MNTSILPAGIQPNHLKQQNADIYVPQVHGWTTQQAAARMNRRIQRVLHQLMHDLNYGQPDTTLTGGFDLKNNQKGILSLTLTIYSYTKGAAHGITLERAANFDISTGYSYKLADLFKPGSNYLQVLNKEIEKQLVARDLKDSLFQPFKGIKEDQQFYIADKTLVIYFDVYEILAYVFGTVYFPISVYALQNVIKEDGPLGKLM